MYFIKSIIKTEVREVIGLITVKYIRSYFSEGKTELMKVNLGVRGRDNISVVFFIYCVIQSS